MSKRLLAQFTSLNALLFDLHRTETELSELRAQQLADISETAEALRGAADEIRVMDNGDISESLKLDADELIAFRSLAARLENRAATLSELAASGALLNGEAETLATDLTDTCNACHSLYRDRRNRG